MELGVESIIFFINEYFVFVGKDEEAFLQYYNNHGEVIAFWAARKCSFFKSEATRVLHGHGERRKKHVGKTRQIENDLDGEILGILWKAVSLTQHEDCI